MKRKIFLRKKKEFKKICPYRKRDIINIKYYLYDIGEKLMGGTVVNPLLIVCVDTKHGEYDDFWI